MSWQFRWEPVKPSKGTTYRMLVATLALTPFRSKKPPHDIKNAELRLYLKRWQVPAGQPPEWCLVQIKYVDQHGRWVPWQSLEQILVAEADWPGFLAPWDATLRDELLAGIHRAQQSAPWVELPGGYRQPSPGGYKLALARAARS